ncbi:hemin uptake protein HemP [Massilia sp. PAMC28688]|uniref:hemin uptake protein HemP n=1 Tax=Massilia sp. PAMC28688 TaxID=2861283 RepID=UPI001E323486|nr:hemin uptake protein HemP [Massilia sp. PAMC28688]
MNLPEMTPRTVPSSSPAAPAPAQRVKSEDLLRQAKYVEIEHEGKIYELRVTRLNKLILTA